MGLYEFVFGVSGVMVVGGYLLVRFWKPLKPTNRKHFIRHAQSKCFYVHYTIKVA